MIDREQEQAIKEGAKLRAHLGKVVQWGLASAVVCGGLTALVDTKLTIIGAFAGAAIGAVAAFVRVYGDSNYRRKLDEKAVLQYYRTKRLIENLKSEK